MSVAWNIASAIKMDDITLGQLDSSRVERLDYTYGYFKNV